MSENGINDFYILAQSSLTEEHNRVLKAQDMFAVFNTQGNIRPLGFENHGIFFEGTRFLSRLIMYIQGKYPLLLSSAIKQDNDVYTIDLTNPDITSNGNLIKHGALHLSRVIFLKDNVCYERIRVTNYEIHPVKFSFSLEFDADYYDIFEVRGLKRPKRGTVYPPQISDDKIVFSYECLNHTFRRTHLHFSPKPSALKASDVTFDVELKPQEQKDFFLMISCCVNEEESHIIPYAEANASLKKKFVETHQEHCLMTTSSSRFNSWLERSAADLFMMFTQTPYGIYPYAGIPWFNTVFGRDGIITALEMLWLNPKVAQGVLGYLAAHQAQEIDPFRDAEPGKILHEERQGEMAALKEIPFGRYYGSIDSTLLFLILAGYYFDRTQDKALIEQIWPAIEGALTWIEKYGDIDRDGFIEYERKRESGLNHQGWKDSEDAIFHQNGELAEAPIALCEVQAYLYDSKIQIAKLAKMLGKEFLHSKLLREAEILKDNFEKYFWCESLGFYALALDKNKVPCKVLSSNAGQCLFSGIVPENHAQAMVKTLTEEAFFSGWGIRTIASSQARYNPMSYHNGSIWPHDNALIAWGMGRYGCKEAALKVLNGLFDASCYVEINRLPELFCGFSRRSNEPPTLYPVACNPQSWASASVFLLLQACLGLSIDSENKRIIFDKPVLPGFLKELTIHNLKIRSAVVDIVIQKADEELHINIINKESSIELVRK